MSEAQAQGQAPAESADTQVEAQPQPDTERTFSQADLKKIAANEKREGKTSAINELLEKTGAESVDEILSAYSEYSEIQEAVTTEADRANARAEKLEAKAKAAEERYTNTLREFALRDSLRDAGINPERLRGAMRLADLSALEVDGEGNVSGLEDVVEAVKEDSPEWFGSTERPRINAPQTNGITTPSSSNAQTPEEAHAQWLVSLLGQ
jgi:hypothetical protein